MAGIRQRRFNGLQQIRLAYGNMLEMDAREKKEQLSGYGNCGSCSDNGQLLELAPTCPATMKERHRNFHKFINLDRYIYLQVSTRKFQTLV
jgi:hypothetical protein